MSIARRLKRALTLYNCRDWHVVIGRAHLGGITNEQGDMLWQHSGECGVIWRYKQAKIEIDVHVEESELDELIRHEAAHVLLGEMHDVFLRIQAFIPEKHREAVYDIYMDAEEHTCERLAKAPFHKEKP